MTHRQHTARDYEQELQSIRATLLSMSSRVKDRIGDAALAFVGRDLTLARKALEIGKTIDHAKVDIEEACLLILARRQPMASDLRFVTLVMKMATDLQRIGDLAAHICDRTEDIAKTPISLHEDIAAMGLETQAMVQAATTAFDERDETKARAVIVSDDLVDALYHRVFEDLLERIREQPELLQSWIHVQSVAKWFERIADHTTNLAEMVIFMVAGRDVRHPQSRREVDPLL